MKLHPPLAALLGLGLLASAVGVILWNPSPAEGRRRAPPRIDRAAEWGVWKVRQGHVTSLDELAAEVPSFVHRGRPTTTAGPAPTPVQPHFPAHARKPVLYLYSGERCRSVGVRVRVHVPIAGSTLYYPNAVATSTGLGSSLEFRGALEPSRRARDCVSSSSRPARAPRGHFWRALRQVPASMFTSGEESERFIFYEALTDLRSPYVFYGAGEHASVSLRPDLRDASGREDVVFAVHAGRYRRITPAGSGTTSLATGDARPLSALMAELREQLMVRGLTAPEARSLLDTWRPDLIEARGDRRIYFLDRADYDAMLPLTISPRPREMVRVGMVIDLP